MLMAGVAKVDITPAVGVRMDGFRGRSFSALAVHDPLWARALVLDDGRQRVGVVALDLIEISEEAVATVRGEASSRWGVSPDGLMIAASHTHSGPSDTGEGGSEDERSYWAALPAKLVNVIGEAVSGLQPALIGTARGWSAVGMNRRQRMYDGGVSLGRNPLGPFDTEIGVIRVDRADGTPLAGVLNYACHALCLADHNYLLSADYPGHAVHFLEERLGNGVTGIFLNGACGDIDPREGWEGYGFATSSGFPQAERSGRDLATRALQVWDDAEMTRDVTFRAARLQVELPTDRGRAIASAEQALAREQSVGARRQEAWSPYVTVQVRPDPEGIERRLKRLRDEGDAPVMAETQVIGAGPVTLVGWPGEIFCELGKRVKHASPFPSTYVIGYANGSIGYVPTPEEFPLGGYEVDCAEHLADNAGAVLVEQTLRLLNQVAG
jgi:neutral ceramidase